MNNKTITINGMHCASCVKIVTEEFLKVEGIKKVSIDLGKKEANIQFEGEIDINYLDSIIKPFGFNIVVDKESIKKKLN
ncbi:MAG TPA: heavy metal-associated domain-containing protein [Spirochaetota bacterium]|nr:heavy metal-associated domain-containing protein [Spirochaetota bacterium]